MYTRGYNFDKPMQQDRVDVMANSEYDIVVIGGGNAALCAAITARRTGAKVLVLEAAPKPYRGQFAPYAKFSLHA